MPTNKNNATLGVTIKNDRTGAFLAAQKANMAAAMEALSDSILLDARRTAPILTGALRSDGRVEKRGDTYVVAFGDSRVPYARRRHYENRKNPQTLRYLERAGQTITSRGLGVYI